MCIQFSGIFLWHCKFVMQTFCYIHSAICHIQFNSSIHEPTKHFVTTVHLDGTHHCGAWASRAVGTRLLTLLLCCSLPLLFIFPLFVSSQISAEIRSDTFPGRMAVEWLLVGHVPLTLLVVISILCGRWPIFRGTIVEKIHHFINIGACDYFL